MKANPPKSNPGDRLRNRIVSAERRPGLLDQQKQIPECRNDDVGDYQERGGEKRDLPGGDLVRADAVRDERYKKQRDWKDERDGEAAFESLAAKRRAKPFREPLVEAAHGDEIGFERRRGSKAILQRHAVVIVRKLAVQRAVGKWQEPSKDGRQQGGQGRHDG